MKSFWAAWPAVRERLRSKKKIVLFLDFDGTLAPIAKTPHTVVLSAAIRNSLESLARSDSFAVVIISGRAIRDLRGHFKMSRLYYVGNHGLEMRGKGLRLPREAKKARRLEALVRRMAHRAKRDFRDIPGVLVEDKNYTLSIHYRNVGAERLPDFKRRIGILKIRHSHWPLVWKRGKKVWEAHPSSRWNKGEAALHLARHFHGAWPVVIGDDVTDESMFRALRSAGLTIRVGRCVRSAAEYHFKSPDDVRLLLTKLRSAKTP